MKIFISADIEGVAGVVTPQHGQPGNAEYERARRLMTEEVNAAIAGAFDGGASAVLVNDSHGPMVNLLPDALDPRAELILGRPKPTSMFAGLDGDFAAAFCTGYHSGAGQHGVLSHTINGFAFAAIRVNGIDCAEATLYGAYAGSLGVPVALLTGDDRLQAQCAPLFPGVRTAVVKHALGQRAARALSPQSACALIRATAEHAVRNLADCRPFVIPGPHRLEIDLNSVALADLAETIPVATRIAPRSVAFAADTMRAVIGWINTISAMSATLR
ncbi:M55 family metallopeptidase [Limobrevibacterium gyesilva]|uniref:M55 family metallopeptidase n=1 Tax=Limobrevibacterium gyesilva TaxID=2991712 RepID=A0AA41YJ87_9PROT|nr:M55 family metallopeptidase [Limobrevibacterium gyesilva]MCW3473565.1 M55 family metallopeptidase [Limobrevibacterium gyesilva]